MASGHGSGNTIRVLQMQIKSSAEGWRGERGYLGGDS